MRLRNYFVREFRVHVLWKKKCIPCILAISHGDFEEIGILGLGAFYFQKDISKEA